MIKHTLIAAALLALTCGCALAQIPNTHAAVLRESQPLITGRIVAVSDQDITVETDKAAQVTLLLDSRTMVPTDMAAGMPMHAQFRVMDDGEYYAQRITPIREDELAAERPVAVNDLREDEWYIRNETVASPSVNAVVAPSQSADDTNAELVATDASDASASESSSGDQLPQTASHQTLLLILGLGAVVASASVYRMMRRFA